MSYDEIYTTLPERPVTDDRLKENILHYLKKNPNAWYNVQQISEAVGFTEADRTRPTIRLACKELLHFQGEPVASCHAGFTYATSKSIMVHFRENMQARVQGMLRTIQDIDDVMAKNTSLSDRAYAATGLCSGVYNDHLWDKRKDPWVCIRCKTERKAVFKASEVLSEDINIR
jgi:hypothetical protein